jgi:hypothetical protein
MTIEYLEKYNPKIEIINNTKKVLCVIRKSYIKYTPEEKVRQAFIKYLIHEKEIPKHRIKVEEYVKPFGSEIGRIDILILDNEDNPFIIYECKKENEQLTDEIKKQGLRYFFAYNTIGFIGYVIGDFIELNGFHIINDEIETFEMANHPNYNELLYGEKFEVIVNDGDKKFDRLNFIEPIEQELKDQFYELGIFGKKTDRKFLPFMINFYNWLMDEDDVFISENIEDIGLKYTKFGSAVSSFSAIDYRTFVIDLNNDKQMFSLAVNSMTSGEKVEAGTGLIVGVENSNVKHSCLQLRIESSVEINKNIAEIWHNGTITIGKLGAAKRKDLIDFVRLKNSDLVKNNLIFLGSFDFTNDIKSNQTQTKLFLNNIINYCIIRDVFREMQKGIN